MTGKSMMTVSGRKLAFMQRTAAGAILLYWITFWADHSELPASVVNVEWSFLIPDVLWIAMAFLVASRWLVSGDRRAGIMSSVAGGSMVYLGLLDIMLNLRNGQYTSSPSRGILNAVVNISCLCFGLANIWFAIAATNSGESE